MLESGNHNWPEFGTFRPQGLTARVIGSTGQARTRRMGRFKQLFVREWLRRNPRELDLNYRGLKLRVAPAENSGDLHIAMNGHHREEDEFAVLDQFKDQDLNFVDIGANVGIYSLLMAQRLAPKGRILAFEPHPQTAARLRQNIAMNGFDAITVVQSAVGPTRSELPLHVRHAKNAGQNTLNAAVADNEPTLTVPVLPLVEVLAEQGLTADIIKADIEGFEDQALAPYLDATPEAEWPRYIMIEVAYREHWQTDLVERLESAGYTRAFENASNIHFARPSAAPAA